MSPMESALIIIKPDHMETKNSILQMLQYNGFQIVQRKIFCFSPEQAAEFYKDLEKDDPCFALKVMYLSKGPAEAVILQKVNAIKDLLELMEFSRCQFLHQGLKNKIHASNSEATAKQEINFIFPNFIFEPTRRVPFGTFCGREKITGIFSEAVFEALENKVEDTRESIAKYLNEHSYKYKPDAC